MNKEEIKEYFKRVDELEIKLTGEDKDTYQWLLFGYNECARLLNEKEQENKELHNKINKAIEITHKILMNNADNRMICTKEEEEYFDWLDKEMLEQEKILKGDVDDRQTVRNN
jgi:hypothetical protein